MNGELMLWVGAAVFLLGFIPACKHAVNQRRGKTALYCAIAFVGIFVGVACMAAGGYTMVVLE